MLAGERSANFQSVPIQPRNARDARLRRISIVGSCDDFLCGTAKSHLQVHWNILLDVSVSQSAQAIRSLALQYFVQIVSFLATDCQPAVISRDDVNSWDLARSAACCSDARSRRNRPALKYAAVSHDAFA